jgi:hypothetical protein
LWYNGCYKSLLAFCRNIESRIEDTRMATQVRLFVSAGPAEEPVRELLGRALAELPISVGWIIKRTPDVESAPECHLFAIVLGSDITAPVGLELWWARRTEKPILAYCSDAARTPAGQVFLQENALLDWSRYANPAGLRRIFQRDLCRFLLAHTDRYGVTVLEAEMLRAYLTGLEKAASVPVPASAATTEVVPPALKQATGAGGGGVILAPGKDRPRGAVAVGES